MKSCTISNNEINISQSSEYFVGAGRVYNYSCIVSVNDTDFIMFYAGGDNSVTGYMQYCVYKVNNNNISRLFVGNNIITTTMIRDMKAINYYKNDNGCKILIIYKYSDSAIKYSTFNFNYFNNTLTSITYDLYLINTNSIRAFDFDFYNNNHIIFTYSGGYEYNGSEVFYCYSHTITDNDRLQGNYSINLERSIVSDNIVPMYLAISYMENNKMLLQCSFSGNVNGFILLEDTGSSISIIKKYTLTQASKWNMQNIILINVSDHKCLSVITYLNQNGSFNQTRYTMIHIKNNDIASYFKYVSKTAIALQSGNAGSIVNVIYSGITQANWVTQGQQIVSDGVQGAGILDGILQVIGKDAPDVKTVTGNYIGTGRTNGTCVITFPKVPKIVYIAQKDISNLNDGYITPIPYFWGESTLQMSQYAGTNWRTATAYVSGNTLSFNAEYNDLNDSQFTYNYYALY